MHTTHTLATVCRGATAAALCACGVAVAAPVAYDEAVFGDLSAQSSPLTTFTFDLGANTVSGTTTKDLDSDFDSFAFKVPLGAQLVGAQVTTSDLVGNLVSARWDLRSGSLDWQGGALLEALIAPSPDTTSYSTLPLSTGDYNVSAIGLNGADGSVSSYTFTFTLRPLNAVPEPGTLALLGAGLAWLALRRRPRS